MKLLRWAIGGASAYVIYRYSIGKRAKGEDVFQSPERALEAMTKGEGEQAETAPGKPKRSSGKAAK
ncbi:hypothetical protein [Novosphingobium album (ex Liu et al. 2023)]|uniref:Uncharacterized protein n=1 Tax=Novosphingobium album (ex Liu et al. 2023) TaxID=3031130 RepID=A0ABT5WNR7_9SPHN|nr:hypothetical protein [Novosphingobium album (ex Liu et al. 2023)]MDE8651694.1 hypothetical protein [Novosphingobium album (ex Liu et al. 2023)]